MDVHFTAKARDDLLKIGDFIAQDSPIRAISFIDELEEKCLSIADSPKAFSLVPRYEAHGIRRRVHGNYLIFYRVEAERVVIIHVLHGALDYSDLFDG